MKIFGTICVYSLSILINIMGIIFICLIIKDAIRKEWYGIHYQRDKKNRKNIAS